MYQVTSSLKHDTGVAYEYSFSAFYLVISLFMTIFALMKVITLLIALLPLSTWAQSEEAGFTADRPGATTGTDVLPKGRLQWEMGMGFEHAEQDGLTTKTWTLNTSMLRWGFSDYAELRLQGDWVFDSSEGIHNNGLANLAIGTKARLFDGWKALPAISLLGNVFIPGSNNYLPEDWGGQIGLLFQNQLTDRLSLGYEGDLIWNDSSRPTFFYGVCLGLALNDNWQVIAEEYNNNTVDGTDSWVELGAAWQCSNRVQLDVSTDIYLNAPKNFWNLQVGIAWQITK